MHSWKTIDWYAPDIVHYFQFCQRLMSSDYWPPVFRLNFRIYDCYWYDMRFSYYENISLATKCRIVQNCRHLVNQYSYWKKYLQWSQYQSKVNKMHVLATVINIIKVILFDTYCFNCLSLIKWLTIIGNNKKIYRWQYCRFILIAILRTMCWPESVPATTLFYFYCSWYRVSTHCYNCNRDELSGSSDKLAIKCAVQYSRQYCSAITVWLLVSELFDSFLSLVVFIYRWHTTTHLN